MTAKARSRRRPRDANRLAKRIVELATDGAERDVSAQGEPDKDAAAVSLGRRGGLKGGPARAAKLTQEQRRSIARRAAAARWSKEDDS